ncbi:hypothetical protein LZ626_20285, partial [Aeromonas allosaccharophila]|uniref:hypothetical protein n=1 Tax=Aeromonas allosaccharophila TaxID=656 RepID=UPI001F452A30
SVKPKSWIMPLILKELFIEKIIVQILLLVFFCSFWVFVAQLLTGNPPPRKTGVLISTIFSYLECTRTTWPTGLS